MEILRTVIVGSATTLAVVACGLGADLNGFSGGPEGAEAGASETSTPGNDSGGVTTENGADAGGDGGNGCPSGRGPNMIRVGSSFCIDSTEVTQSQYLAFTQDKAGDTTGQPTVCVDNVNYGAGCGFNPSIKPNNPVEAVDWCDAFAFCKWAGKRLCGKPNDPTTQDPAKIGESGTNAWYAACTGGGSLAYPYGEFYDATKCNGGDAPGSESIEVGSMTGCVGGYPGLFDMTGNVLEWVDFCSPAPDAGPASTDTCYVMGGNYQQGKDAQRCLYRNGYARNFAYCGFGFRCCADL